MFKFSPEFRKPQEIVIQPQIQRDPDGKDAPDAAVQGTEGASRFDDLNSAVDIMK